MLQSPSGVEGNFGGGYRECGKMMLRPLTNIIPIFKKGMGCIRLVSRTCTWSMQKNALAVPEVGVIDHGWVASEVLHDVA